MNWGYKILTVYLVFVAGIAVMVYKSSSQKIDLVTPDYYARELKYQERIDAVKRTEALADKVTCEVKEKHITILLPAAFASAEIQGNVLLYYPADKSKDIRKDFTTSNRTVAIEIPPSAKGAYQLQASWIKEGLEYYFEQTVFL